MVMVDPFERTVKDINVGNDMESVKRELQIEWFEFVYGNGYVIVVDEEGMLKDNEFFKLDGRPLAGRAMFMSMDDSEDIIHFPASADTIRSHITFPDKPEGWTPEITTEEGEEEHPVFGKTVVIRQTVSNFGELK